MDNRKFIASFGVRIDTRRARFEVSPGPLHGGPEGTFRVWIDRRWHDGPDGQPLFLDRTRLAGLVVESALGDLPDPAQDPCIPSGTRVSVRFERSGANRVEGGFTAAPAILAHDGRWVVPVVVYGGTRYIPADDIVFREDRHGR